MSYYNHPPGGHWYPNGQGTARQAMPRVPPPPSMTRDPTQLTPMQLAQQTTSRRKKKKKKRGQQNSAQQSTQAPNPQMQGMRPYHQLPPHAAPYGMPLHTPMGYGMPPHASMGYGIPPRHQQHHYPIPCHSSMPLVQQFPQPNNRQEVQPHQQQHQAPPADDDEEENEEEKKRYTLPRKAWKVYYDELVAYTKAHGNCHVPGAKTPGLGRWVMVQRRHRRIGKLQERQINLLDELGFDWKDRRKNDAGWEKNYQKLLIYKQDHGHYHIPKSYEDQSLFYWAQNQRQAIRQGTMDLQRKEWLDAIDFYSPVTDEEAPSDVVASAVAGAATAAADPMESNNDAHNDEEGATTAADATGSNTGVQNDDDDGAAAAAYAMESNTGDQNDDDEGAAVVANDTESNTDNQNDDHDDAAAAAIYVEDPYQAQFREIVAELQTMLLQQLQRKQQKPFLVQLKEQQKLLAQLVHDVEEQQKADAAAAKIALDSNVEDNVIVDSGGDLATETIADKTDTDATSDTVTMDTNRPKVLNLGMSFPGYNGPIGTIKQMMKEVGRMVKEKNLTEMDGRDLVRNLATEIYCGVNVYTVSMEEAAKYDDDRHMYANFNRATFISRLDRKLEGSIQFRQVLLDYYWIPTGWDDSHWKPALFDGVFRQLTRKGMLDMSENQEIMCGIYLPFCDHCFRCIVKAFKELKKEFVISFLKTTELKEVAVWKGTQQIPAKVMQQTYKKKRDQEEVYCRIGRQELAQKEVRHVRTECLEAILERLEDFDLIRMIKLEPLEHYIRRLSLPTSTEGGWLGLKDAKDVERGWNSADQLLLRSPPSKKPATARKAKAPLKKPAARKAKAPLKKPAAARKAKAPSKKPAADRKAKAPSKKDAAAPKAKAAGRPTRSSTRKRA